MGGDLEKIRTVGEYFVEVWKIAGVDFNKVEVIWASDLVSKPDYWKTVILVAKQTTLNRALRCLTIMGRKAQELKETAQLFYPMMQCADIFHLSADMTQLGLDQRRVNILAREVGPKIGYWKPVIVSHHMLLGLQGRKEPGGYDEKPEIDIAISSKMSKSKPSTNITVHDSQEEIRRKIRLAYCPPKQAEWNPLLDYAKHIIFRAFKEMKIERPIKYGGEVMFNNYEELEREYVTGRLHPLDLKEAIASYLDKLIKPIREHFERNSHARELYRLVKTQEVET